MMIAMESPQKQQTETLGFAIALIAPGRSPEIPEALDVFGWFVGDWELDIRVYWTDVSARHLKGEVHVSRVLEGRAVQDVWIMPRRSERSTEVDKTCNMYGSTLRMWDPGIQAWRVTWTNPVTARWNELIACWQGKTSCNSALILTERRFAGSSARLPGTHSTGRVSRYRQMAKAGSWRESSTEGE